MNRFLMLVCMAPVAALAQPANVQLCASCHGAQGEGNLLVHGPRIAGQPQAYLERQLAAFADGRRKSTNMVPIAKVLSAEQRAKMATWYAEQSAPAAAASASGRASAHARGRTLATSGDESLRVPACNNCHAGGSESVDAVPYLSGLEARYLAKSLAAWGLGTRTTDPSGQMNQIARALTDADRRSLATYYSSQRPPRGNRTGIASRAAATERADSN